MKRIVAYVSENRRSFFALLLLLFLTFVAAPFTWHLPELKGITAEIVTDGQHMIITNGNDFVWENATVTINETYQYRIAQFPRGGTAIPLNEFVDSRGVRFPVDEQQLRAVKIDVSNGEGGESGYLIW